MSGGALGGCGKSLPHGGQWMSLYRAIDSVGDTVEFFFSEKRDMAAAKRFLGSFAERGGILGVEGCQTA